MDISSSGLLSFMGLPVESDMYLFVGGISLSLLGFALLFISFRQRKMLTRIQKQIETERFLQENIQFQEETFDRLRSLLMALPDAVFRTDRQGRIDYWSEIACSLTEYTAEEMEGRSWRSLLKVNSPKFEKEPGATPENDLPDMTNQECEIVTQDNRHLTVLVSSRELPHPNGTIQGSVTILKDITPIKELEDLLRHQGEDLRKANSELENLAKHQTRFLSHVSHELRTPLNSILGFSGILLDQLPGPINEEQKKQLQVIYRQSQRLLDQINELLDVARLEAGRITLNRGFFQLEKTITYVIDALEPLAKEKQLELEFKPPEPPLPLVYIDPKRMEQILVNLVGNAVKYTEKGKIWVECRAIRENATPQVEVCVCDTGIGIDIEEQGRIFEEFWQSQTAKVRTRSGLGLGLAITKQLVEMLEGTIHIDSTLGEGTKASVCIPIRKLEDTQRIHPLKPGDSGNQSVGVLADDQIVAMGLIRMLEHYGIAAAHYTRKDFEQLLASKNDSCCPVKVLIVNEPLWAFVQNKIDFEQSRENSLPLAFLVLSLEREGTFHSSHSKVVFFRKPVVPDQLLGLLQRIFKQQSGLGSSCSGKAEPDSPKGESLE